MKVPRIWWVKPRPKKPIKVELPPQSEQNEADAEMRWQLHQMRLNYIEGVTNDVPCHVEPTKFL